MDLSKCYSIAVVRGHANVRTSRGSHLHKEPETNKTTVITFCLNFGKASLGLGIILLVAPNSCGRVVTRPWEGFPHLLWPLVPLLGRRSWDEEKVRSLRDHLTRNQL